MTRNELWLRQYDGNTCTPDFHRLFETIVELYERIAGLEEQLHEARDLHGPWSGH